MTSFAATPPVLEAGFGMDSKDTVFKQDRLTLANAQKGLTILENISISMNETADESVHLIITSPLLVEPGGKHLPEMEHLSL
jgi:hypothetical protein